MEHLSKVKMTDQNKTKKKPWMITTEPVER